MLAIVAFALVIAVVVYLSYRVDKEQKQHRDDHRRLHK